MAESKIEAMAPTEKNVEGNVLSDELSRTIYSSGACIYSCAHGDRSAGIRRRGTVRSLCRQERDSPDRREGYGRQGRGSGKDHPRFHEYMNEILKLTREEMVRCSRRHPGRLNALLKPMKNSFPSTLSTTITAPWGNDRQQFQRPHAIKYGGNPGLGGSWRWSSHGRSSRPASIRDGLESLRKPTVGEEDYTAVLTRIRDPSREKPTP